MAFGNACTGLRFVVEVLPALMWWFFLCSASGYFFGPVADTRQASVVAAQHFGRRGHTF